MKQLKNLAHEIKKTSLERDKHEFFDRSLIKKISNLNVFNLALDDSATSLSAAVKSFNYLGRSLDIPLCTSAVAHWIFIHILEKYGTKIQKDNYMHKLLNAELLGGIANSESKSGTALNKMKSGISEKNSSDILVEKSLYTNGPADLIMCSIKSTSDDSKFDMLLLDHDSSIGNNLTPHLFGFKTGATGSLIANLQCSNINSFILGKPKEGARIMRLCFDLERLMISAILNGVLFEVSNSMYLISKKKEISCYQHIQEKIISAFSNYKIISSLILSVLVELNEDQYNFKKVQADLSNLKNLSVELTTNTILCALELEGYSSLSIHSHIQKLLRDAVCLKFLGGTKELHKNFIFNELNSIFSDNEVQFEQKIREPNSIT